MNETALKCNSCGGIIPLGYRIENKKFVIDSETAPIVVEAFERYARGETINEIVESFNKRGLKTSKGYPSIKTASAACSKMNAILEFINTKISV